MESRNQESNLAEEAGERVESVKTAAQQFIKDKGINLELGEVEKFARNKPLAALAISAAAGFIIGGGLATKTGLALMALLGRRAATETATNWATGMMRRGRRSFRYAR
jgi:ElaB/YqjD/DUF883 family membrane-anchored ribosome-binding protein